MSKKVNVRRMSTQKAKEMQSNIKAHSLKDLVGFTLIDLNERGMVVEKDGHKFVLLFIEDEGDCCGYSEISTSLYMDGQCNPVITDVQYMSSNDFSDGDSMKITLFGLDRALAELNAFSYSGSGWEYGSSMSVMCKALEMDEILTQW